MILLVLLLVVLISSGVSIVWSIFLLKNYDVKSNLESKKMLWIYIILGIFGAFLSTLLIMMYVIF